jgi:hypothetical protein
LILNVDVLSYLDPADTQGSFGPILAVPGGLATGEVPIVDDLQVNLLEGLSSAVDVQSVSVRLAAIVRDSTGSGADTLRLYVSDDVTPPRSTTPVVVAPFALSPGVTDTVEVNAMADPRVAALFASRKMTISVTTSLRGPSSGAPLNGDIRLSVLSAQVIAKRSRL